MAGIFTTTTHFIGEAMNILNTLLALAPIITVFLLLVVFKLSAKISMAIAYVVTALLAVFFWQAAPAVVAAATVNGMIVALTILYIVFGAILCSTRSKKAARFTLSAKALWMFRPTGACR